MTLRFSVTAGFGVGACLTATGFLVVLGVGLGVVLVVVLVGVGVGVVVGVLVTVPAGLAVSGFMTVLAGVVWPLVPTTWSWMGPETPAVAARDSSIVLSG